MSKRDKLAYSKMFGAIKEYADELRVSMTAEYLIMDMEQAVLKVIKEILFPRAELSSCHYHLKQNYIRKIGNVGLKTLYTKDITFRTLVHMTSALAFLPYEEVPSAFDQLKAQFSQEHSAFVKYISDYYVHGKTNENGIRSPPKFPPSFWSVYNLVKNNHPKTQNHAESWHNRLAQLVDKVHGGFFFVMEKIKEEASYQQTMIQKSLCGFDIKTKEETNINKIVQNRSGYCNVIDYLKAIARNTMVLSENQSKRK